MAFIISGMYGTFIGLVSIVFFWYIVQAIFLYMKYCVYLLIFIAIF